MAWFGTSVARCARIRARVAACARREDGELLIEVLFSAMLVALISGAILNAFAGIAHLAGDQRHRVEANALAEQDQARLRGLTITQLAATGTGSGNTQSSQAIDGETYTITSKSQYISGSSAGASCASGPANTTADEVETSSQVTWGLNNNNDNRNPVIIHGLVTPKEGGSLIVAASTGATGASGLAGLTASLSGPTTVSPLTTDNSGCAIFGGLAGGSYTVAFTPPAGYIDVNGNTTVANQTQTVVPTSTAHVSVGPLAQPGGINASFSTTYKSGGTTYPVNPPNQASDQFIAVNQGMTPNYRTYGTDSTPTNNAFQSTLSSGNVLFPFSTAYTVYAGGCTANLPLPASNQVSATVTSNNTTNVTIPEPAMIILPYAQTPHQTPSYTNYDVDQTDSTVTTTGLGWTSPTNAGDYTTSATHNDLENTTNGSSLTVTLPINTTSVTVLGTRKSTFGYANLSLNGVSAGQVDMYSAATAYAQPVYQNASLNPAIVNKVVITEANTVGHSGGNKTISVDEIKYTTVSYTTTYTTALMTTAPHVIVTETDAGCGSNKDYPPTQIPSPTQGALQYPGMPYGNYSVCVDDGTNHVTQTVANTNFTAGTTMTANIYSGGTGEAPGVCT